MGGGFMAVYIIAKTYLDIWARKRGIHQQETHPHIELSAVKGYPFKNCWGISPPSPPSPSPITHSPLPKIITQPTAHANQKYSSTQQQQQSESLS